MLEKHWILGDAFAIRSKHHDSIKALWETKWRFPVFIVALESAYWDSLTLSGQCLKGVYPFHDGKIEDFEPVFDYLIKVRTCSILIRRFGSDKSAERYQRRL